MSKRAIQERLREGVRLARIERDSGNESAHNTVVRLSLLLQKVRDLKGEDLMNFAESWGFDIDE